MRIVFAGTPQFAVPALDALHGAGHDIAAVYTQPDRPAGRGRQLSDGPVKRRAQELGLMLEQPDSLRDSATRAVLAAHAPDLMVVVAYGLLLPAPVLAVPRLGCVNIHASLLPRWRGAAPIQRAILAGDERSGVSIMQMDVGLDTGPVLLMREIEIGPRMTGGQLHDRLAELGARCVVEAIDAWLRHEIEAHPQSTQGLSYARKLHKDEARIDWTNPAVHIDRQVRAFDPWPVAETRWQGQQLRIWSARPHPSPGAVVGEAPPGSVVTAAHGVLTVSTGEGLLLLERLQLAGRRVTDAADFLNAHDLAGARFE